MTAFTTGVCPDGRKLAPIRPWHSFAAFAREDAFAIAAYLKSLPPVVNDVPGPFGPDETPSGYVLRAHAPNTSPQQIANP